MIYWQSIQFNILKAFNFSPNGFIFSLQFIIFYMKNRKLSLSPSLYLKVLTYPLILDHINTNGIATSSKYPIKCLELTIIFSNNFEITVLSKSTSYIFLGFLYHKVLLESQHHKFFLVFLYHKILLLLLLSYQPQHHYTIKKFCCQYFLAISFKDFYKSFLIMLVVVFIKS